MQHIRNVPGRKSDRNDAAWIADLLAHGLIRGSFVPPAPIQELRDLTRTRKQLVGEVARHTLRLQKTLEDANVKLTRVVNDILGVSGRAILTAIIAGETDPKRLADCATGRLKASRADIVTAVHGGDAASSLLLKLHLAQIDALIVAVQLADRAEESARPGDGPPEVEHVAEDARSSRAPAAQAGPVTPEAEYGAVEEPGFGAAHLAETGTQRVLSSGRGREEGPQGRKNRGGEPHVTLWVWIPRVGRRAGAFSLGRREISDLAGDSTPVHGR